jgi:TonB-linked SusC/RagA family outer membrane protein
MFQTRGLRALLASAVAVAMMLVAAPADAQQTGTIRGVVQDAGTQQPIPAAQVVVEGLRLGGVTDAQGRFLILNVPAGEHVVRVEILGYAASSVTVTVAAGATATANIRVVSEAIALQEVIVTGVAEGTRRAVLPINVDQISAQNLPVPSVSAGGAIQGKVAGATVMSGTGRPGAAPTILLRAPTSINAAGRNQEPLYIVDGVILSSSVLDIDALDIENVEVVKGAAAASMYGSRAQAGVVNITTRRGRTVLDDRVRYTARTEYGQSQLPGSFNLTQRHQFLMTEDGSQFRSNAAGNPACDWLSCPSVAPAGQMRHLQWNTAADGSQTLLGRGPWNTIMREQWPGVVHDHVDELFTNGAFNQHYLGAEGRSGATNYHASYSFLGEEGVMPGQEGFKRHNFRLNLDQAVRPGLQMSGSAFYSRSTQNAFPESQGNPMFNLTRMPAGVSLRACLPGTVDDQGRPVTDCSTGPLSLSRMIIRPDPFNENDNPLYEMLHRNYEVARGRFLGSANVRWTPVDIISLDANVSFDRLDYGEEDLYPKGFRDVRNTAGTREGRLYRYNSVTEGLNASLTGTVRQTFGQLATRTTLRYLWEQQDDEWTGTTGFNFRVGDVPTFDNVVSENISAFSGRQPVRSDGYFGIVNLMYQDRYILDALVRNDGSSLFGTDQRRQWYYRAAGAWRISEEDFFQFPGIDEFKVRYAIGTAGGRPSWAAQYETYSVTASGVAPVTLGNVNLRPEHTTEQELGLDAAFMQRFVATVNYASGRTTDQILSVPQPAYTGFANRWMNAGTLESNTWELSLDARLVDRPNLAWSARLLWDRTRQEITELNVPAYTTGVAGQNLGGVFNVRAGEAIGTFYGTQIATSCAHLPAGMDCSQFAVNNDGLLVWVGGAGSPNAGWQTYTTTANDRPAQRTWWGTQAPVDLAIRGVRPMWGEPIVGQCTDRITGEATTYCPLGTTMPDYKLGLSSNLTWRGFQVYGLLESVQGISVYNQPLQWATFQSYAGIMDQSGMPEAEQKPVGYYSRLYGVSGLAPSSRFVEDGSFVKLRELAVRYRLGGDPLQAVPVLRGFDGVTFSMVGRNLFTWTDYDGYDPETGRGGGGTGSAALARVDGYNYPPFRTFTFGIELNF